MSERQEDFWAAFEVIHTYTRRQAIEDGVLVQLSGPGYEGDAWVPEMVAEAGIKYPLAMTATAFHDTVAPIDGELPPCQDIKGRLWDVLWMLTCGVRGVGDVERVDPTTFVFTVHVVPNGKEWTPPKPVRLKAVCGPGDDAEPVLTIMYPEED